MKRGRTRDIFLQCLSWYYTERKIESDDLKLALKISDKEIREHTLFMLVGIQLIRGIPKAAYEITQHISSQNYLSNLLVRICLEILVQHPSDKNLVLPIVKKIENLEKCDQIFQYVARRVMIGKKTPSDDEKGVLEKTGSLSKKYGKLLLHGKSEEIVKNAKYESDGVKERLSFIFLYLGDSGRSVRIARKIRPYQPSVVRSRVLKTILERLIAIGEVEKTVPLISLASKAYVSVCGALTRCGQKERAISIAQSAPDSQKEQAISCVLVSSIYMVEIEWVLKTLEQIPLDGLPMLFSDLMVALLECGYTGTAKDMLMKHLKKMTPQIVVPLYMLLLQNEGIFVVEIIKKIASNSQGLEARMCFQFLCDATEFFITTNRLLLANQIAHSISDDHFRKEALEKFRLRRSL
jgi:hypothetical protein